MSDKNAPVPWEIDHAVCGKHETQVLSIYHRPNDCTTLEVVEPGCECGDEAMSEANALHIVHCVNHHAELVEALREAADSLEHDHMAQRDLKAQELRALADKLEREG